MQVFMCVHMDIHICEKTNGCVVWAYMWAHVNMYSLHMHVCMQVFLCEHVCVHAWMREHVCEVSMHAGVYVWEREHVSLGVSVCRHIHVCMLVWVTLQKHAVTCTVVFFCGGSLLWPLKRLQHETALGRDFVFLCEALRFSG